MPKSYKLFEVKKSQPGKLFPLYVNADKETPIGEWLEAEEGPQLNSGKVKSKLGPLAFRPGWHSSDYPLATHIGVKGDDGTIQYIKPTTVWCECEYSDAINYQEEADNNGLNPKGILNKRNAYLKHIPEDGYYRYKTNPNMFGDWIISGKIKINKVLSDDEVRIILKENNLPIMERYGGDINLKDYGF